MSAALNAATPPVVDPVRMNALLAALTQQRDAALNQVVMLSADLASVRDALEKAMQANAQLAEPPADSVKELNHGD